MERCVIFAYRLLNCCKCMWNVRYDMWPVTCSPPPMRERILQHPFPVFASTPSIYLTIATVHGFPTKNLPGICWIYSDLPGLLPTFTFNSFNTRLSRVYNGYSFQRIPPTAPTVTGKPRSLSSGTGGRLLALLLLLPTMDTYFKNANPRVSDGLIQALSQMKRTHGVGPWCINSTNLQSWQKTEILGKRLRIFSNVLLGSWVKSLYSWLSKRMISDCWWQLVYDIIYWLSVIT